VYVGVRVDSCEDVCEEKYERRRKNRRTKRSGVDISREASSCMKFGEVDEADILVGFGRLGTKNVWAAKVQ